jgi:hypothetical protein
MSAGLEVPEAHVIPATGEGVSAVGAEGHAEDALLVSFEDADVSAGLDVAEAHGVVNGPGESASSVRAECEDYVSFEDTDGSAALEVPESDAAVQRSGERVPAVKAESHAQDTPCVSF